MSEFYAQIVKIDKVEKHQHADTLSIYTVLNDYPVIDKTGKFAIGELVSYIPESAIVPDNDIFYFLCPTNCGKKLYSLGDVPEKYRTIKSKCIRGVYSQGLILKIPEELPTKKEGYSIVNFYSLKREIENNEDNINTSLSTKNGNNKCAPKKWDLPYYDIEGLRKYIDCIQLDEEIVVNEKLEGCNSVFCFDGQELWVKSRRFFKKEIDICPWWIAAKHLSLKEKLSKYPMYAFWGELIGLVKNYRYDAPIINGNIIPTVRFFDIYDINNKKFLDYDDMKKILNDLGLSLVPELYRGLWLNKDRMYELAEGKSNLSKKCIKEGFVLKPTKERWDSKMEGRMILKLKGKEFNLNKH